ncbi:LuxR family transcriptional regulator [Streptomyces sp. NPDC001743]|uniref:LuxR family transcriptional regulator n=1 Tax=Streptomyces sp. NPDC001743 TaxID=3154397 RepID=UPI0033232C7C
MSARIESADARPKGAGPDLNGSDDRELVGREREQEQVAALLAVLPRGGQVLHVRGAPGTGKSALLRFAAEAAVRQGIRVLSTSSAPAERGLRHAALHSLLRPRLARLDGLPDPERLVLDAAFTGGAAVPSAALLAEAVLSLLDMTPGPVLLCVDDFDRLDAATRDVLRHVARRGGGTPLGMILAERSSSGPRLTPDGLGVTLEALPGPQARLLVASTGRATGYTEQELVLAVAEGNPLALTELSLGSGPLGDTAAFGMLPATPRLAEAYAEDLAGLSAAARTVLLTAALSTSPATRDILDASSRLLGSPDAARSGLAETAARGLVVEEGHLLGFPRPLVRPVVLHTEPAARRLSAHAALGRSLAGSPHAAWHTARCAGAPDEELARRLEALAAGPRSGTGVLVALSALEAAAVLSPEPESRAGRLLRAAELACDHGLPEQALRLARRIDPTELGTWGRALLLWIHELLRGNSAVGRGRIAELCEAARAVAAKDPALAQKLLHAAARRSWWQQAGPDERRLIRATFEDLRSGPRDARDLMLLALTGPPPGTSPAPSKPLPDLPDGDEESLLGHVAHLDADLAGADLLFAEAEAAFRAGGRYGRLPQILVPKAMGQILLATRWDGTLALAEEAGAIAARTGQPDWAARATGTRGIVEALRGHGDQALECAAQVEEASLRLGETRQLSLAVLARALTASGAGRYAEAYVHLRSLFAEATAPYSFEHYCGLAFLAEAATAAGETDDARTVVGHFALVTGPGRAPLLGRTLDYASAVLSPDDEAEAVYHRALGPGAAVWPLLHGMTQFAYGAWLRRRRRLTESRIPLAAAESVFRTLGAGSRAEQAASELRATGGAAAARTAGGDLSEVLSPQQLTIARLAARGLTNRAIGEHLRLSPRTVASHLYQIFPKMDVTSRAQLAARFRADENGRPG